MANLWRFANQRNIPIHLPIPVGVHAASYSCGQRYSPAGKTLTIKASIWKVHAFHFILKDYFAICSIRAAVFAGLVMFAGISAATEQYTITLCHAIRFRDLVSVCMGNHMWFTHNYPANSVGSRSTLWCCSSVCSKLWVKFRCRSQINNRICMQKLWLNVALTLLRKVVGLCIQISCFHQCRHDWQRRFCDTLITRSLVVTMLSITAKTRVIGGKKSRISTHRSLSPAISTCEALTFFFFDPRRTTSLGVACLSRGR